MMVQHQGKDLFNLQSELIEMKVNMTVNNSMSQVHSAINQVIEQISQLKSEIHTQVNELRTQVNDLRTQVNDLRTEVHTQINELKTEIREEIHELRHEMRDRFSLLENRVTAVETRLGMVGESRKEIRNRFIDYCFKAGWLLLGATVSYFALQMQLFIR